MDESTYEEEEMVQNAYWIPCAAIPATSLTPRTKCGSCDPTPTDGLIKPGRHQDDKSERREA
jgi:hypothetical protein